MQHESFQLHSGILGFDVTKTLQEWRKKIQLNGLSPFKFLVWYFQKFSVFL